MNAIKVMKAVINKTVRQARLFMIKVKVEENMKLGYMKHDITEDLEDLSNRIMEL